ncbi:hypothetical protein [Dactylosporangium sp. CA-139066]|uniref:hypothetical protein n=1 Tax=Dactylosporangium sp. CA-139066 TaxID=3239930 RepID=UPI003D8CEACE
MKQLKGSARALCTMVGLALTGWALVACTGDAGGGKTADTIKVDAEHPFSIFLGEDISLVDYAQQKIRNQCLKQAGYPQDLQAMLPKPPNEFAHLVITPATFGPTTDEEARRIGFGTDQPPQPPAVVSNDPNYDKAMDTCSKEAWDKLGKASEKLYFAYFDLGNKLSEPLMTTIQARSDPQTGSKLLGCLEPKGYHPADEQAFRKHPDPRTFGIKFGAVVQGSEQQWQPQNRPGTVEVGPPVPERRYQASAEEGALAVAWRHCRQDTGLAAETLRVARDVQADLVQRNEDAFIELNPQVEAMAKRSAELVGR